jgi:ABC-type proline/glycine betaine transport system substrate-binding protein
MRRPTLPRWAARFYWTIDKEFGLKADVVELGALNAFIDMENGTVDIHPETWEPEPR